jgi:hypothetical protein
MILSDDTDMDKGKYYTYNGGKPRRWSLLSYFRLGTT